MPPQIVYEDNELAVLNKPAGLLTHPKNLNDQSPSVTGWLIKRYPQLKTVGSDPLRPGIVHRLDKETSGLMVIAKTQEAFEYLKKLFQERKIQKTYLALVYGKPKNKAGKITTSLGKLGARQTVRIHGKKELKEKIAITEYRVLKNYSLAAADYSLLEVRPHTGRTHQIRVHLNSLGHPVIGDPIYGGRRAASPPGLNRLFLHAQKLSFVSPSGKALALETDLPPELRSFLETIAKNQKLD